MDAPGLQRIGRWRGLQKEEVADTASGAAVAMVMAMAMARSR